VASSNSLKEEKRVEDELSIFFQDPELQMWIGMSKVDPITITCLLNTVVYNTSSSQCRGKSKPHMGAKESLHRKTSSWYRNETATTKQITVVFPPAF
jgi:hypothetical protein